MSAEPPPRVGRRTGGGAVLPPRCHLLAASDLSDVHPRRGAEGRRTARPRLECAVSPVLVGVGLAPGACCSLRGPRGTEAVTRRSAGEAPCLNVKFDLGGEATLTAKQTRYFWTSL